MKPNATFPRTCAGMVERRNGAFDCLALALQLTEMRGRNLTEEEAKKLCRKCGAGRERPTDPCATWAERRQARDEWEAPAAENECGASYGAETSERHPNPTLSPEAH